MLKIFRLLILLVTPLLFWGAWYVVPGLLDTTGLRWLSGVVTVLWGLEFYFLQRLSSVSAVDGLTSKEHQRLVLRLATIRRRVWWIGGVALACSLLIWVLTALQLPLSSPIYAALVGVLFGISLSYLILIPIWVNESQSFIDKVQEQSAASKKRSELIKNLEADLRNR